ncbi:ketopantoate reductase family protein [Pseudalkalibacillus berkeleyi]|uniref:2-dehydropantoate 2-reductase n=1 Tax=Pseudalkalibacillus berkeleyi TaxID=1069813 RepID=A0ABS9H6C1_9BACL|nr:ketopantoate reductase family protein [Pseudalkalibacillus berkeleyi]MCF6139225.1 ketopantoate reductase family protein [Pseudalkalibacillus berkeleyi]
MNIVVLGAGALGAYFGARCEEAGHPVQFLVRYNRAEQLRKNGLKIQSPNGDYQVSNLNIVEDTKDIEQADVVILAVKGYHLNEELLSNLKALVQKGARVLPLLNGIEHIQFLQDELGEENVLGGLSYIISTLDDNGHVIHSSAQHDLIFGPLHPSQTELCNELETVFDQANMAGVLSSNILLGLWNKYMVITAFSGVTTAGDLTLGTIRETSNTMRLAEEVLHEVKLLAIAKGVNLNNDHIEKAKELLSGFPSEATSSMHQDRRKGMQIEADHLLGGALRLAAQEGLKLPHIETLYALVKPYELKMQ